MENKKAISLKEAIEKIAELEGSVVSYAWRGHGSALFLELGHLTKNPRSSNPYGEQTVMIEWSWRLEGINSIILGSWSESDRIDKALEMVTGKVLEEITFFSRLPELSIQFNHGLWLLSFMTEKGDPAWSVKFKNGEWLSVSDGEFQIEKPTDHLKK